MRLLFLPFTPRYITFTLAVLGTIALAALVYRDPDLGRYVHALLAVFALLVVLGVHDLLQKKHSILRNYPISAHIRFLLESIRREVRQYFFESEKDGRHFREINGPSSISAPKASSTNGHSAPNTTSTKRATNGFTILSPPKIRRESHSALRLADQPARSLMPRPFSISPR